MKKAIEDSIKELISQVDQNPDYYRCEYALCCGFYKILKDKLLILKKDAIILSNSKKIDAIQKEWPWINGLQAQGVNRGKYDFGVFDCNFYDNKKTKIEAEAFCLDSDNGVAQYPPNYIIEFGYYAFHGKECLIHLQKDIDTIEDTLNLAGPTVKAGYIVHIIRHFRTSGDNQKGNIQAIYQNEISNHKKNCSKSKCRLFSYYDFLNDIYALVIEFL